MKKSTSTLIIILIFSGIAAKFLNINKWYLFYVCALLFLIVDYLISIFFFRKKRDVCPQCGNKISTKKCRRNIDSKKEKIYIGHIRFFGNATKFYRIAYCQHCGWEEQECQGDESP